MNVNINFDRTSASLREHSAFVPASREVASLKGALNLRWGGPDSAISVSGEIFPLVAQWSESVRALMDDSGSQHTIFGDNGGVVLERRGRSVNVTFDPALTVNLSQSTDHPIERTTARLACGKFVRATLDGTGQFCNELLAINPALEHFQPVQIIMRHHRQMKEHVESMRGLSGILNRLRTDGMIELENPWKWAAVIAVAILILQMRSFNAKVSHLLSQMEMQNVGAQQVESEHRSRVKAKAEKATKDSRPASPKKISIGIPGSEPRGNNPKDAIISKQTQALKAAPTDVPLRPLPIPPVIDSASSSLSNRPASPSWKLVGMIEFGGERTAVLERSRQNSQDKTTVYKKIGESLESGGWTVSEMHADRIVLTRKKAVRGQRSATRGRDAKDAVERLTLTIGQ